MTISSIAIIMSRIRSAETDSPIAVFVEFGNQLNAVFGATIATMQRIAAKDRKFIGSYDRTMNVGKIRAKLTRITKRNSTIKTQGDQHAKTSN